MTVLELACGSGQLSFRLAPNAKHWEATDFSENMIAEAKKNTRPRNLFFSVKDATDLPFADESFDAVMIANTLHIMPERSAKETGGLLSHLHFQYAGSMEKLMEDGKLVKPMWYATMCAGDGMLLDRCNIVRALHRLPKWTQLPEE